MTYINAHDASSIVELGELSLRFGRIFRITYHHDGVTPESDTDHTVMLGLICCAFAQKHFPELDLGLIAQYCLVHDLIEVYAGDTPTLRITEDGLELKRRREKLGADRIRVKFRGSLPWVSQIIDEYEGRRTRESRYVKAMDKLVPKITHILNGGVTIREQHMTREMLVDRYKHQLDELMEYAPDFPEIFVLREDLIAIMFHIIDTANGWGCEDE